MNIFLLYLTYKYNGNWDKILKDLNDPKTLNIDNIYKLENILKTKEINYITILDKEYPEFFKNIFKPPFCLFYKGNLKLLNIKDKITLSGNYLTKNTAKLIEYSVLEWFKKTNESVLVIQGKSNLEIKIALLFLNYNKKIIFISSDGVDNVFSIYPELKNYQNNFLVISEYLTKNENSNNSDISTYRLLAALSDKLILYSLYKSKSFFKLIDAFLDLGKDVCAFPNVDNDNDNIINNLINDGANVVTSLT
ncbi:DNA-processing protein DprA [Mycoplasma miroungirhinis]|uniref:Smf/DprA SLOG domain-containing protein n=1 Tax=Mycoplasma miroungirhinis TaxID=754516 RepID=A0A6M4JDS8_9MOLU|nr:DNA-processing protein DprA [Mycoplasma miroungirhinis]QJR44237.1 hypothetical protein HLA92_02205 [Mycoplasma miroungirhinis]